MLFLLGQELGQERYFKDKNPGPENKVVLSYDIPESLEPMVLRAKAGDCLRIKLKNKLQVTQEEHLTSSWWRCRIASNHQSPRK